MNVVDVNSVVPTTTDVDGPSITFQPPQSGKYDSFTAALFPSRTVQTAGGPQVVYPGYPASPDELHNAIEDNQAPAGASYQHLTLKSIKLGMNAKGESMAFYESCGPSADKGSVRDDFAKILVKYRLHA